MPLQSAIKKLIAFEDLSSDEMTRAMQQIMHGDATAVQIAGFLVACEMKGPTITEVASATQVMRDFANKIQINSSPLIDIVGTGGDLSCSFNISTTSAFVVAAAGGIVAKHGNRSVSSSCGSADVLERAGVNLDLTPAQVTQCIEAIGIGFLFAQKYHTASKYAAQPRKELGVRTFFNLLGPLTNPANATHLMVGVFDHKWLSLVAKVLANLQCERALVVHSQDGLDEISCAEPTDIVELRNGNISAYTISPEDFGFKRQSLTSLQVKNADESLAIMLNVFNNVDSPARTIILLNAGAAIYNAGITDSIETGIIKADEVLTSGKALEKFKQFILYTQQLERTNDGNV